MGNRLPRSLNRSNLYLVRLWPGNAVNNAESSSSSVEWSGKVQRIVNGETQTFSNLQELVNLLEAMSLPSNGNQTETQ